MPAVGTVSVSSGGDTKVASGLYLLKLQSVEDVGISERYPDSGNQWLWKWEVVRSLESDADEDQQASIGEVIYDYTRDWLGFTRNGAPSKSLARIDACLGVTTPKPDDEEEVELPIEDTDELVGRQVKAQVAVAANTTGALRAKLATIAAYKRPKRAAAPPPDEDEDAEDDGQLPF